MPIASCQCGKTKFELTGVPIMTASCHCESCRMAAERFVQLGAPSLLDADGGVACVLMRKDRVTCLSGFDLLRAYRLTPKTGTRRMLARCCNTPMFIDPGTPWLSFFLERLTDPPPVGMRLNRLAKGAPSDGVPSARTVPFAGMWRITRACALMGFRNPKLDPIEEAFYPA